MGRDFGGSASGNTSQTSDTEFSAEENQLSVTERMEGRTRANDKKNIAERGGDDGGNGNGTMDGTKTYIGASACSKSSASTKTTKRAITRSDESKRAFADALGDHSDVGSDGGVEADTEADVGSGHEQEHEHEHDEEEETLEEAECRDKSLKGSVY